MVQKDDWEEQFTHTNGISRLFVNIEPFDNHYDGAQTFFTVCLEEDDRNHYLFFPVSQNRSRIEEKEPNEHCQTCHSIVNEMYSVPHLSIDPHSGISELDIYSVDVCASCLDKAKEVRDKHKAELGPKPISKLI